MKMRTLMGLSESTNIVTDICNQTTYSYPKPLKCGSETRECTNNQTTLHKNKMKPHPTKHPKACTPSWDGAYSEQQLYPQTKILSLHPVH